MKDQQSKASQRKPSVVGTGLLSLDVIIKGNNYQSSKRLAGGTCGNVLIILSYLGWDAYPVTRLNGDTASRRVLRDLKQWGVRLDFAKSEPRVATPIIIHKIVHDGAGEASHRFSLKCPHCGSWLPTYKAVTASTAQRVIERIENPKVFFMDRVSRGSLILAKASAEKGALIVFEPAGIGDPRLFREALDLTHVLKYSNERMHGLRDLKLPVKPLLEIETLGHKGLRYRCRVGTCKTNGWRRLDSYKITQVKDAAGSGDWCTAGIIHRVGQEGLVKFQKMTPSELQDAFQFGQALAAWNCGFEGSRGGMYEVDQRELLSEISEIMSMDEPKASIPANNPKALQIDPAKDFQRTDRPMAKTKALNLSIPSQAQVACCF